MQSGLGICYLFEYLPIYCAYLVVLFQLPQIFISYQVYLHLLVDMHIKSALNIIFLSNHNINKSSFSLCFWASDPLIENF